MRLAGMHRKREGQGRTVHGTPLLPGRNGPFEALHLALARSGRAAALRRTPAPAHRPAQDCGSNPNSRNSCAQRQARARRAAQATASARDGSSSTVKPPVSGASLG